MYLPISIYQISQAVFRFQRVSKTNKKEIIMKGTSLNMGMDLSGKYQ